MKDVAQCQFGEKVIISFKIILLNYLVLYSVNLTSMKPDS